MLPTHSLTGKPPGLIGLLLPLPTAGGKSRSQHLKPVRGCIFRRMAQTQGKAAQATGTALRLVLQATHRVRPFFMIPDIFDDFYTERRGIAHAFGQTEVVFSARDNIGVGIIYGRSDAALQEAFYYSRGAGGAARMQQHLVRSERSLDYGDIRLHNSVYNARVLLYDMPECRIFSIKIHH